MPSYLQAVAQSNAVVSGAEPSGDIGWSLRGAFKKVGRGIKKTARVVRRNPLKAAAVLAVPGLGVTALAAKGIRRVVKRKKGQPSQSSEAATDETETETQTDDADDTSQDEESEGADGESSGETMEIGWDDVSGDVDEISGDEISGVRVRRKKPGKARKQPMGFVWPAVAAGATQAIQVASQTLFRGRRLVIADYAKWAIEDIKVGNVSQLAGVSAIPAAAFAPETTGEDNLQMDSCAPGVYITLVVKNISAAPADFYGALFGDSVQ